MAKKLFLMATEPQSGKALAAFGILDLLRQSGCKAAFFRPIIGDPQAGKQDEIITKLLAGCKLDIPYADAYGLTLSEARELANAGKESEIYDTVLAKCKKLEDKYDFVLCLSSDFYGHDAAFEFTLNARCAADLGSPALVLVKGAGRGAADITASARTSFRMLRDEAAEVFGCFVNWSQLSGADAAQVVSALAVADGDHKAPVVHVLPEDKSAADDAASAAAYFGKHLDGKALAKALLDYKHTVVTPKMFEFALMERAKKHKMRIVLPEGEEERILRAAADVSKKGVADIILLGKEAAVKKKIADLGLAFSATIIEPEKSPLFESYVAAYFEARKAKGITPEKARETMLDTSYFGTMMVQKDDADGMVSGSINTTAHTIKPAFEFVKTKPGITTVSSLFLMCMKDRVLGFGDCAVNPNPTPDQLAGIAVTSARTAKIFGVEPRVAMLSYSTGSSGKGPDVDAVVEAVKLAKEMAPDLALEGPLQYDAAIVPEVAKTKMPGNPVAGKATVFIFPTLNAGNIAYKAVQRAANAVAVGPVLQGLNKPVNDLSRGCTVPDVINTIAITAVQAQAEKGLA